ncbi:MAG: HD domain-containing protein [Candidatus Dormibacteria bacterium]
MGDQRTRNRDGYLVAWAIAEVERRADEFGDRWAHVAAVAEQARWVSRFLPSAEDEDHLIAAAYMHDVGYCASVDRTGFHPYDGALFIREAGFDRLAELVAHHSGADWDAALLDRAEDLKTFPTEKSAVADGLTYCDLTTGPAGERMTLGERTADVIRRYGKRSVVAEAMALAMTELEGAIQRTESLIEANRVGA